MREFSIWRTHPLAQRWCSSAFRFVAVYAVVFAMSVMVLLGFVASMITHVMESETDVVMHWEVVYFDSLPDSTLAAVIRNRLERERMHANYYGLFAPDGQHIAGDILAFPDHLKLDRSGLTLDRSLTLKAGEMAPVVRAIAVRRPNGDRLVLARDLTHILRIREMIIDTLLAGGFLSLIAGIAGGLVLSLRQMQRLKIIRQVTSRIAQGDLGQRLPIGGRDELDMLAHLVNHMLTEVERLMHEVKGVCDGIAHDLRTPLFHVQSLLTRAVDRAVLYDDAVLRELVDRARRETGDLLGRFRAMLRIAEIGAFQRRGGFDVLDLGALVAELGQLFEPLAESCSIRFDVLVERPARIHGDRALLFEAISNLLDNAFKYTHAGGAVCLELRQTAFGPQVDVVDNGIGIAPQEREAVLAPGYRSERTRHLTGGGLGLSIVAAVVNVHDFTLHIGDADPGTRVSIDCWSRTLA